jgi:tetratricopeptide (TPR) repeat protein
MKSISKISILFVLLFSTVAVYSQCDTYLQKANSLFAEKKYEEAKRQYTNYKECKPNATGIDTKITECDRLECEKLLIEAQSLHRSKNYSEAIDIYNQYKKCNPNAKVTVDAEIENCYQAIRRKVEAEKAEKKER